MYLAFHAHTFLQFFFTFFFFKRERWCSPEVGCLPGSLMCQVHLPSGYLATAVPIQMFLNSLSSSLWVLADISLFFPERRFQCVTPAFFLPELLPSLLHLLPPLSHCHTGCFWTGMAFMLVFLDAQSIVTVIFGPHRVGVSSGRRS